MVTSGNGLELVHSKVAQRGGWVAFHLALASAMLFIPTFPGLDAWFATEFGRIYCAFDFGIIIAVTLVSRTGRMFVHLFQWWLPVHLFGLWVGIVFEGLTTGNWAFAGAWGAVFSSGSCWRGSDQGFISLGISYPAFWPSFSTRY